MTGNGNDRRRAIKALAALFLCRAARAQGQPKLAPPAVPRFAAVVPGVAPVFPRDHGAHPDFRIEWWYFTGWLATAAAQPCGFQVTFFRIRTATNQDNPSRFAPRQLLVAHAAVSDSAAGKIRHSERAGRAGVGAARYDAAGGRIALGGWQLDRNGDGWHTTVVSQNVWLDLAFKATQPVWLQGEGGYSRKGAHAAQASYYYSVPQLHVSGTARLAGAAQAVTGRAWMDHEWSSELLDARAVGWDWIGVNLADGGALMAYRIRDQDGRQLYAHAATRTADGTVAKFVAGEVEFVPRRRWTSPLTQASYPVEITVKTGHIVWTLVPLIDDQEVDARRSVGAAYWEGAVSVLREGRAAGRGYLEMTGYAGALRFR